METVSESDRQLESQSAHRTLYDVDDYEHFPDDGKRYEIVQGDLYVTPAPSIRHQTVLANLVFHLSSWAREAQHGIVLFAPTDVQLGEHDILQPDLVYVSSARREIIGERRVLGAPDLVVEILSETTAGRDKGAKRKTYERHGVQEYWIVDPDRSKVIVFAADNHGIFVQTRSCSWGDDLDSVLLPGLSIAVDDIFFKDSSA